MSTQHMVDPGALAFGFGDKVRKVRRAAGLGQGEFGEAIGVTGGVVASWEGRGSDPRQVVAIARRIQLAYGVSAQWLLGLSENPTPGGGGGGGRLGDEVTGE